jgi:hypothetical protein
MYIPHIEESMYHKERNGGRLTERQELVNKLIKTVEDTNLSLRSASALFREAADRIEKRSNLLVALSISEMNFVLGELAKQDHGVLEHLYTPSEVQK